MASFLRNFFFVPLPPPPTIFKDITVYIYAENSTLGQLIIKRCTYIFLLYFLFSAIGKKITYTLRDWCSHASDIPAINNAQDSRWTCRYYPPLDWVLMNLTLYQNELVQQECPITRYATRVIEEKWRSFYIRKTQILLSQHMYMSATCSIFSFFYSDNEILTVSFRIVCKPYSPHHIRH